MNFLWYVLRIFYVIGLFAAVPLFLFMVIDAGSDPEVANPVVVACAAYFVFGYLLLKSVPDILKSRILTRVARHKAQGFLPQCEIVSVLYNRYIGFDPKARKTLYLDINDGTETLVDYDNLIAWELEVVKNKPALLKLLTSVPTLPVVGLHIDGRRADEWKANLHMIFG